MVKGMPTVRRIAAAVAFAVAFLGWVAAFITVKGSKDLENRLSSTEAELMKTKSALVDMSDDFAVLWQENREYRDTFGQLEKGRKELSDNIARLKGLSLRIDEAEARLAELKTETIEQQTLLTSTPEKLSDMPSHTPLNDLACLQGDFVRVIRVKYSGLVGEPPCSVIYEKSSPEEPSIETLWRTNHEKGYCEARAGELVEKLRGANWKCGLTQDVLGVSE